MFRDVGISVVKIGEEEDEGVVFLKHPPFMHDAWLRLHREWKVLRRRVGCLSRTL